MSETADNSKIQYWQEVVKSSGCSYIQEVIKGKKPSDFSPDMLEWMADFVLTTPEEYEASPKKPSTPDQKNNQSK